MPPLTILEYGVCLKVTSKFICFYPWFLGWVASEGMLMCAFHCVRQEDEEAFETFAVYCGLALHHAKLYDKIRRSEQKYRVALDVLSYHNTCLDEEVQDLLDRGVPDTLPQVDQ